MRDLPFVPFFTSDWLASSARVDMTLPERAIYLDLLFQIWERGGAISSDEARLAKMAMVTPAEFSSAWSAVRKYLVVHPDEPEMLTNLKMLDVIRKQANVHEARSSAGRRGAASRWADGKGDGKTDGGAMAKTWHPESESESETERERERERERETEKHICASPCDTRVSDSSSSRPKRKRLPFSEGKEANAEQSGWFSSWWDIYFLKKSKKAAFVAFCRHVKTAARFEEVMAATRAQSPEMLTREEKHRPHGATWLNGERWNDPTEGPRSDPILDAMYGNRSDS